MKLVLLFFVWMLILDAKELSTCYSIQLLSFPSKNSQIHVDIPSSCQKIIIKKIATLRCGCYSDYKKSQNKLLEFKEKYPKSIIVSTYRYRFEKPIETQELAEDLVKNKLLKKHNFTFNPQKNENKSDIQEKLKLQLGKISLDYHASLLNQSDFYGLSLYGKYEQYINQNYFKREYTDYEYDLKIKFEFFKNGFFGHRKKKEARLKSSQVSYLKELSLVLQNQSKEKLSIYNALVSQINLDYFTQLSVLYEKAIFKRESSLKLSLSTVYEVDMLRQMYHRLTQSAKIYKRHKQYAFTPAIYALFQEIDTFLLKDIKDIKTYANVHNVDLYLQDARHDVSVLMKDYTDEVSMNLYVHRRTVDELGWYNTIGVEANLPIDFTTSEENSLARLEQKSLHITRESVQKSIENTLEELYCSFEDIQSYINIDKDDISYLNKRIQKFQSIKNNIIPNLDFDPDEKILLSSKKIIDLKFAILLKRAELFKILGEIASLCSLTDVTYLIKK